MKKSKVKTSRWGTPIDRAEVRSTWKWLHENKRTPTAERFNYQGIGVGTLSRARQAHYIREANENKAESEYRENKAALNAARLKARSDRKSYSFFGADKETA